MTHIGVQVRNIIERRLDEDATAEGLLWQNIAAHQNPEDVVIPEQRLDMMRQDIKDLLIRDAPGDVTSSLSTDPVDNQECTTVIRAHSLEAWARVVGDPAVEVAKWLYQGAPAGLSRQSE